MPDRNTTILEEYGSWATDYQFSAFADNTNFARVIQNETAGVTILASEKK
ncbi:uncharacterized protein METZ01_LOCUS480618 [marine metagenome]|uniref:Uncharacterized protein n=1 Tax=marine metagenome TaxID=408172 RepID=A0A383C6E7_9ZZZZ